MDQHYGNEERQEPPVRFFIGVTWVFTDEAEEDGDSTLRRLQGKPDPGETAVKISIDMWDVMYIMQTIDKADTILVMESGEEISVKGKFSLWYERWMTNKRFKNLVASLPFYN